MIVLGTMSGSSLDGLDLAICRFQLKKKSRREVTWDLLKATTIPYSKEWSQRLREAPALSGLELYLLDYAYGYYCSDLIKPFIESASYEVDLIGWHGHTVFHDPDRKSTLQIGKGSALAGTIGIPVIGDLRAVDLAMGGQGAPLAPIGDLFILDPAQAYLNLGGISNLTATDIDGKTISFDVSPCGQILNMLANRIGQPYDAEGSLARAGQMDTALLKSLNRLDYYQSPHPKSLDNNWIKKVVWPLIEASDAHIEDKLHTCCHHIVKQITRSIVNVSGKKGAVIATGGGVHNSFLMDLLRMQLAENGYQLQPAPADLVDYKEAVFIGLMAYYYASNLNNVISSATGSTRDHIGGALYQGWRKQIEICE